MLILTKCNPIQSTLYLRGQKLLLFTRKNRREKWGQMLFGNSKQKRNFKAETNSRKLDSVEYRITSAGCFETMRHMAMLRSSATRSHRRRHSVWYDSSSNFRERIGELGLIPPPDRVEFRWTSSELRANPHQTNIEHLSWGRPELR